MEQHGTSAPQGGGVMGENLPGAQTVLKSTSGLLGKIEELLNKLPKFPEGISVFVKWIPWAQLVFLILAVPVLLALIGIQALFLPFAVTTYGSFFALDTVVFNIVFVLSFIASIVALPGLFKRSLFGWKFAVIAELLGIIPDIYPYFSFFGIILAIVYLRVLVQLKPNYR